MINANTEAIRTAAAAWSFAFLIARCSSLEIISHTFSKAVLNNSQTNTKQILNKIANHSRKEIFRK